GTVYWAEVHVPSGLVAVLASTVPVLLLLLGRLLYGIRATAAQSLGVGLAFIGVAVLFCREPVETSALNIVSMAAVLLSMVFTAAPCDHVPSGFQRGDKHES
ncbi:MAG: EamA family transporter, partial [Pyrinomonadaceae bacterium]